MENWKSKLNADPTPWLLESNPWTQYRTLTDLLEIPVSDPETIEVKTELLRHNLVLALAEEAKDWISIAPTRNNDAKISYFKLRMLGDFGITYEELDLSVAIEKATAHMIDDMFAIRGELPARPPRGEKYQKPDPHADVWHVSPCNSPAITAALIALGVKNESLDAAIRALHNRWMDSIGWFCHFFFVENQHRKMKIGCPIAGLMALDVFSRVPALKDSGQVRQAFEPIKFHKEFGKTLYYFGRSTKFWTFKYPFVWYNALFLADVLTRFDILKNEKVVKELVDWIIGSQDEDGRFKPTSIFMEYKHWDFSNKKEPSPWITFLCCRILKQYYQWTEQVLT
jgi:hypothetical protein